MNYSIEILINLPRVEVLKKLTNVDNFKHWQSDFVSAEYLSGEIGEFGAKMKLQYNFGRRTMVMIETITKQDLPFEIHYSYSASGMYNVQQNMFKENTRGETIWISKNEFVPTSFKMRLFLWLMPKTFKNQSLKYMNDFKNFAENNISLSHA